MEEKERWNEREGLKERDECKNGFGYWKPSQPGKQFSWESASRESR